MQMQTLNNRVEVIGQVSLIKHFKYKYSLEELMRTAPYFFIHSYLHVFLVRLQAFKTDFDVRRF